MQLLPLLRVDAALAVVAHIVQLQDPGQAQMKLARGVVCRLALQRVGILGLKNPQHARGLWKNPQHA